MNISKELEATESFSFDYNGQKVNFEAVKASLTPRFIQDISKVTDYPKAVASVVKDWDVTSDDEGTKWPLDEASLAALPVRFLSNILDRIGESWSGEEAKKNDSASGSAATAK